MRWERLTSAELDAVPRDVPVVLSVAAVEQHGPHLALGTDAVIGRHLLDLIEEAAGGELLLLPQVAVGCSEHHMDYPGSLTVSHATLLAYAGDVLRSVLRHGFSTLVVLNSHGGNRAILQVLVEQLGAAHPASRVALLTWWQIAAPALAALRASRPGGANHACEFETALMMRAAPDLVRPDLIPERRDVPAPDWLAEDMLAGPRGLLYRTMRDKSGGDGVVGEPRLASAGTGAAIGAAVRDAVLAALGDLRAMPRGTPRGAPA
jgi:creatinine amidohydrolase